MYSQSVIHRKQSQRAILTPLAQSYIAVFALGLKFAGTERTALQSAQNKIDRRSSALPSPLEVRLMSELAQVLLTSFLVKFEACLLVPLMDLPSLV